eukprot:CAMPEP_0197672594 /NCGR_PEP_ID=MMETSP1338-20131121/79275_1 /TAXON_ID=43686 ORGANISM="Pelagodinium beii, Strain RCC1491" /NCGR_SAMPLE_ID=MMETSP1338 /ASSEMBLY_ACC=CAM_ASM_000754 /LENGTH=170 /DNA_ID=CAMNT_0043252721 /DNA_START=356 /DNA_END=870 /DNA_ORIENTATION=+
MNIFTPFTIVKFMARFFKEDSKDAPTATKSTGAAIATAALNRTLRPAHPGDGEGSLHPWRNPRRRVLIQEVATRFAARPLECLATNLHIRILEMNLKARHAPVVQSHCMEALITEMSHGALHEARAAVVVQPWQNEGDSLNGTSLSGTLAPVQRDCAAILECEDIELTRD